MLGLRGGKCPYKELNDFVKDAEYFKYTVENNIKDDKTEMKRKQIIVYAKYIPKVGGIETITYNLVKLLSKDYDVTLAYDDLETPDSLLKFIDYADVIKLDNYILNGDICIICSNYKVPQNIKAKKYIQWIHSDYEKYRQDELANADKKIKYVAVSQHCADVFEKLYKIKPVVIPNFPDDDKEDSIDLRLCTVTRLSGEKGRKRMMWLCKKLRDLDINYIWTIVGDNSSSAKEEKLWRDTFKDFEEVSFVGYKSNPYFYMEDADYTVLLSDFEGSPLVLLESLKHLIPVITTSWGGADEIVKNGENGYILPLRIEQTEDNMIKKIAQYVPVVDYHYKMDLDIPKMKWLKLLNNL